MTAFTRTSPTMGGLVPVGVTEVGGIVIDLIGVNGVRVVSQIPASSLYEGFANGNPLTIGTQTGFSPTVLAALGGGIAQIAIRITLYDGDTASWDFDYFDNTLRVDGVSLGDFSRVSTQNTSNNGLTAYAIEDGFRDERLNTGWFFSDDPAVLAQIWAGLQDGSMTLALFDEDPYDNYFDFKRGIDGGLINVGQPPVITNPVLKSTAGDDILTGTAGVVDVASYEDAVRGVVVDLAKAGAQNTRFGLDQLINIDNLTGSAHADSLFGDGAKNELKGLGGADSLHGRGGDDTLLGGEGRDSMYGGDGNDVLNGGAGGDQMSGGAGADRFVYAALSDSAAATGVDRIIDFNAAVDLIDLSALDANSGMAGDQAFSFVSAFSGAAGQAVLTYDAVANATTLRLDVNGDGSADFELRIDGNVGSAAGWVL